MLIYRNCNNILISFSITVLYACSDEFHQLFVPGRAGMIQDVMIDSIGIILALCLIAVFFMCKSRLFYPTRRLLLLPFLSLHNYFRLRCILLLSYVWHFRGCLYKRGAAARRNKHPRNRPTQPKQINKIFNNAIHLEYHP